MPSQKFYEGTELVLEADSVVDGTGWTEIANGSTVTRHGDLVTLALQLENAPRAAWVEATEYAVGALVTEGGKTWRSLIAANKEHKPATSPVDWAEVVTPAVVCTLGERFRPAAEYTTPDGNFHVKTTGVVESTYSLEAKATKQLQLSYVASTVSP